MGRRSLAGERRAHIIAATLACVSSHGIAGTTLERIAEAAGMGRSHVRHYAGNRDELLVDAARAFYFGPSAADAEDTASAAAAAPLIDPDATLADAIAYLLSDFAVPTSEDAAAFAFMDASRTMPAIREIVLSAYAGMQTSLEAILLREYPESTSTKRRRAAYALVTLAIGHLWFLDLEMTKERESDARHEVDEILGRLAPAGAPAR